MTKGYGIFHVNRVTGEKHRFQGQEALETRERAEAIAADIRVGQGRGSAERSAEWEIRALPLDSETAEGNPNHE